MQKRFFLLFLGALSVLVFMLVKAQTGTPLVLQGVGWAYANGSGIGWVKFSSASENGFPTSSVPYGVQIDPTTGLLSGQAWSNNYGWLSFNQTDLTNCPGLPCEAKLQSNQLTGWGVFTARKNSPGNGAGNGWVHLSGTSQSGTSYGVLYDSSKGTFSGAAWAGDVAGWLVFGPTTDASGNTLCSFCDVRTGGAIIPPTGTTQVTVSNVNVSVGPLGSLWCDPNPYYSISWTYTDSSGYGRQRAVIDFLDTLGNVQYSLTDTPNVPDSQPNQNTLMYDPIGSGKLKPGTVYSVRVTAYDTNGNSGQGVMNPAVTTPTHYPPLVDFIWNPSKVTTSTPVSFVDKTIDRSGGKYPFSVWNWLFTGITPAQSTVQNPGPLTVRTLPPQASLQVTDSAGDSCSMQQQITTGGNPLKRRIFVEH